METIKDILVTIVCIMNHDFPLRLVPILRLYPDIILYHLYLIKIDINPKYYKIYQNVCLTIMLFFIIHHLKWNWVLNVWVGIYITYHAWRSNKSVDLFACKSKWYIIISPLLCNYLPTNCLNILLLLVKWFYILYYNNNKL